MILKIIGIIILYLIGVRMFYDTFKLIVESHKLGVEIADFFIHIAGLSCCFMYMAIVTFGTIEYVFK